MSEKNTGKEEYSAPAKAPHDKNFVSVQAKVPYDARMNLRYAAMKSKMGLQEYISELCYLAEPFKKN